MLCRIEEHPLSQVPRQGPLILVCNHVNFLDAPLIYTHLQPRPVTGFAKAETWDDPILGYLFDLWGAIPVRRGEADLIAMKKCLYALKQGKIFAITPEGTRAVMASWREGVLGVVSLALISHAPLLPLVYFGGEHLQRNLRQLQRTDFHIRVGRQFSIALKGEKATHEVRQKIADEIMYQLAALLPPEYRGVYSNLDDATTDYLQFSFGEN